MSIFEKLPPHEVQMIQKYLNSFGGSDEQESYITLDSMEHFLRFWSSAKAPLYKMFGNNFILKREVCYEKDNDDLVEDMHRMMHYDDYAAATFRIQFEKFLNSLNLSYDDRYELKRFINDMNMLVRNEYDGPSVTLAARLTTNGHPLQINSGCKASKMLGKICKALGFTYTAWRCPVCGTLYEGTHPTHCNCCNNELEQIDGYETFRRAHSLVLNQKMLRGNLCLSIHPLDYITMSDNDSGWDSCMHWVDDAGDYRLGTIEMMNSQYCIVAYVEARNPWDIYGVGEWNNKRWRQLIMITPEIMVGNKQYPYENDYLQGTAMKWVRDLANASGAFGPYDQEAVQIQNRRTNTIGNRQIYMNFWFDYMYNDIYDYRMAFVQSTFRGTSIDYNLSGEAVCTCCGEVIPSKGCDGDVEPSWTLCRECCGMWRCSDCGSWCYGEPYYPYDSDEPLCDYCYHQNTVECEVCGDRVLRTDPVYIELLPVADEEHECYNWNFMVGVCRDCLQRHVSDFEALFGPIKIKTDMWGRERNVVELDNITDEGLSRGSLDPESREILRQIRDTKTITERVGLITKNLY